VPQQAQEPLRMVFLVDELDVSYAGRLGTTLADAVAANDEVRVDLSAVRAIDSSCIRELLRFQAVAARDGKSFTVVAPNANVRRLLIAADALDLLGNTDDAVPEVVA
jgi:anti-anti-sigma regulatory factor